MTLLESILGMNPILAMVLLTLVPALELRGSIPYGILVLKEPWLLVFLVCVITNTILGPVVYALLDKIIHLFTRIKIIDRCYKSYEKRVQRRIKKYIERWGELGVAIFIGIPLPGSGSYSGALAAYLIGLKFKKFIIANIIGVLIAAVIVTAVTLTGSTTFQFLIKAV